jgi:RNA polymerase sigma-70 factor (ECF subfamily)
MVLAVLQTIEDDQQREVIERLFYLYHKCMLAKANEILHNWHDAEDAVQETFYKVSRNYEAFIPAESIASKSLIAVYTRNVALNMYAKNKRHSELFYAGKDIEELNIESDDPEDNVIEMLIDQETISEMRRAIDRLDDLHRDVIVLKYYHHMKNSEIADVMEVDVNTVNARVFRAKKKLMILMKEGRA